MAAAEPEWEEVVRWMQRTQGGAIDAARHFFPGVAPDEHAKLAAKYRKWWQRHGSTTSAAPTTGRAQGGQGPALPPPPRPAARVDLVNMSVIERLEWQLGELGADLDLARQVGDLRAVAVLDKRFEEVGAALDVARARAARVLRLDKTPAAIAAELERKREAIALRVEMQRRAAARAQQAKERDL